MKKKLVRIYVCILLIPMLSLPNITGKVHQKNDVFQQPKEAQYSTVLNTDWWPMFHHDLSHTGYSTSKAPETNKILWSYDTGSYGYSSPAVVDDKVYFGSGDHNLYCLNASNGAWIWNYTTNYSILYSSPAINNGRIYIGSDDSQIYCLNASTGVKIWEYPTESGYFYSSPAISNGKLYVGSNNDHKIYCLNASTGAWIWDYTADDIVRSSPAVVDGKVYIGSDDSKMYCLDASTGAWIWDFTADFLISSSPTVTNGKVYFRSDTLYCLNALNGSLIWDFELHSFSASSTAVIDNKIFIGASSDLYCMNASNGDIIWDYNYGSTIYFHSPVVADGKVYAGSARGKLFCLNASTGKKIWDYGTSVVFNETSLSPAIANGKIYILSNNGIFYCFGSDTTPPVTHCSFNGTNAVTVTITATDNESGVNHTYYNLDATGYTEYHLPFMVSVPGNHSMLCYSVDKAGNQEVPHYCNFTVVQPPIMITIKKGLGVTAVIKNTGATTLTNISWKIELTGGIIIIGKTKTGVIPSLAAGAEYKAKDFVIGLGKTDIAVQAGSAMTNATGIIILFLVIRVK